MCPGGTYPKMGAGGAMMTCDANSNTCGDKYTCVKDGDDPGMCCATEINANGISCNSSVLRQNKTKIILWFNTELEIFKFWQNSTLIEYWTGDFWSFD